ncbi:tRNA-splicing endonuclease subunit Sen15 isoform X2 [Bufo gargarizans]|uniref:tRNA-splicing endonuclease subunit Sen15 isoform X2 n=1 Tax=Bufo gargarizans TaxID=30331 RepID=UPI001CF54228|nr:tRNA-splicing endonuclease subunit Sen15 isoform X2 [Bufo gargarizans]
MDGPVELSAGAREGEEPWIVEHPKFKEMMMLDVADSTQVYAAFLVYMDLLEVRNWNTLQILSSSELRSIYLCGKEKEDSMSQVIIPTPVTMSCSHERIQQFLKLSHTSEEDQGPACSVLLAVVESDSTIVYYKLTDGFVVPDPPDFVEDVDHKRWKKKKMRFLR